MSSSHRRERSQASSSRLAPPPTTIIVTTPPWANEPPSDEDEDNGALNDSVQGTEHRTSEAPSRLSSHSELPSRWWVFNESRNRVLQPARQRPTPKFERRSLRDISLTWMPASVVRKNTGSFALKGKAPENSKEPTEPNTVSHTVSTPKLDSPREGPSRLPEIHDYETDNLPSRNENYRSRKNGWRSFILTNVYVPLLFRFVNISFTTTALALSIRIRNLELKNGTLGAVGSSPTVVIIFGPPTLVHVFVAIYLEYLGRPLGLWRTSAKLAYTLVEVLFICLWSAALSIAFDNFFTSLIPCAPPSASSWYNQLSRPPSTIPISKVGLGDKLCDYQLSLICLVGFGLIAYCSNLIISLYRIFEKVKYHAALPPDYH